ncbi:hypothetical protein AAFN85_18330 [Mucilaginibacter sp. CAU 1740]|uniref:OB-fold protein n=1 Tax=Mucilaginibacter sp. CAU 1740 TaxID=3140365 RepID=UPI00325BD77F
MKHNKPSSDQQQRTKLFLYLIFTIVGTVLVANIIESRSVKKDFMTTQKMGEDTSSIKEDSVQVADEKIPASTFESDYSAESWYKRYKANPVAFNDKYDQQQIDIHGTITDISLSLSGYSIVTIGSENNAQGSIICDSEKNDKDAWRNEVKALTVGQEVHIRGFFWKSGLDWDNFHMERCHVID